MMIETPIYPFESGIRGIPFQDIPSPTCGINITSESGAKLTVVEHPGEVSVFDRDKREFFMKATVEYGKLALDMQTKVTRNGQILRHPDFFGKPFIQYALGYFFDNDVNVISFQAGWSPKSDNYKMFMESLRRTRSKVQAAKNTWSGRIMIEQGFSQVNPMYIHLPTPRNDSVSALFEKPLY